MHAFPRQNAANLPLSTVALVAALTLLAWGGVLFGSFQYDDFANILTHSSTMQGVGLEQQLATGIRPLTRLSYASSAWFFGTWAGGWLAFNLFLHALSSVGVALLAHARGASSRAASFAGACFAVVPTHAAVVAYVSGRSTGLAVALMIASLLAHTCGSRTPSSAQRRTWQALALTSFVLACAAKEIALVLPALVLLWERCSPQNLRWRESIARAVPFVVTSGLMLAIVLSAPRYRDLLMFSLDLRSPLESLLHNLIAWPMTVRLWVTPWALSIEQAVPVLTHGSLAVAACAFGLVTIGLLLRLTYPTLTLASVWMLVSMLPTHSVIAKVDAIAEGSLYLAAIGPAIGIGVLADRLIRQPGRGYSRWVLAAIAAMAVTLCSWRVYVWSDPVRLWREATVQTPASPRAWTNLGIAYLSANEPVQARIALLQAQRLEPANVAVMLNLELLATLHD